ncbi:MAG: hypothetical protein U0R64_02395 [Candidatus Nanopelagicales bacterium]
MFRLAIAGVVPDSVAWRIGKDDRSLRGMIQADPAPVPDPGREELSSLTALAQRQRDLFHAAGLARDEQGSPPR